MAFQSSSLLGSSQYSTLGLMILGYYHTVATYSVSTSDAGVLSDVAHDQSAVGSGSVSGILSDTITVHVSWSESASDSGVLSETLQELDSNQSASDAGVLSDTVTQSAHNVSVADAGVLSDLAAEHNSSVYASVLDAAHLSDFSTPFPPKAASQIDYGVLSDSVIVGRPYAAAVVDHGVLVDVAGSGNFDSGLLSDTITVKHGVYRFSDSLAAQDAPTSSIAIATAPGALRTAIFSGLSTTFPFQYAETDNGLLLIANGIDPMIRWDGLQTQACAAGVPAPTQAITLADGAPAGVANATVNADSPTVTTLTGSYTAYLRFVDMFGNVSNLSPVSNIDVASSAAAILYSNVQVPTDPKIVRRQILRNTAGQSQTYYIDIDTTDVTSTSFYSQLDDLTLSAQIAVPLFDTNNNPIANLNGVPPAHKRSLAVQLGRVFAAGEVVYKEGSCQVTNGSTVVQGIGTRWPNTLAGRGLYVIGTASVVVISSVDVDTQVITLAQPYPGLSDQFAEYAIRPLPSERRLVYYSEAGKPESWPLTNTIEVQEDGDEIIGTMSLGSYIYIVEKSHLYKYTFQSDPALDGFVFYATARGALNPRLIQVIEGTAYMLDGAGVHAFTGDQNSQPISEPIQSIFQRGYGPYQINWDADQSLWHASTDQLRTTVRFFVALDGHFRPHHALCYNYRIQRWWIESYPVPICSSCNATIGYIRPLVGCAGNRVASLGEQTLDGISPTLPTIGSVGSGDILSFTDSSLVFSSAYVGHAVSILTGVNTYVQRTIAGVSGSTLYFDRPLPELSQAGDAYQIGGINWEWSSGVFRYISDPGDATNPRYFEAMFSPCATTTQANLQVYQDFNASPIVWGCSIAGDGYSFTASSSSIAIDMTTAAGYILIKTEGMKEQNVTGPRFVSYRLFGTQGAAPVVFSGIRVDGVESQENG